MQMLDLLQVPLIKSLISPKVWIFWELIPLVDYSSPCYPWPSFKSRWFCFTVYQYLLFLGRKAFDCTISGGCIQSMTQKLVSFSISLLHTVFTQLISGGKTRHDIDVSAAGIRWHLCIGEVLSSAYMPFEYHLHFVQINVSHPAIRYILYIILT